MLISLFAVLNIIKRFREAQAAHAVISMIDSVMKITALRSTCRPFTFQVEKTYCTIKQKIHKNYTVPTIFLPQKHSNGSVPKHLTVVSKRSGDATLAQVF